MVNLRRELAPRLSVDRTKILAYREEDLERLLWQAIPALVAAGPAVLTYEWLYTFTYSRPLIADVIFEQAIAAGYTQWSLGGDTVDASIAGCFNADGGTLSGPDELVEWRLTALAAAGLHAKLVSAGPDWGNAVRARPSDALLVSRDIDGTGPWLDPVETVPLAHLVRAARRIGRGPSELAARLEQLGYNTAYRARDARGGRRRPDLHQPRPRRLAALARPDRVRYACRTCSRRRTAPAGRSVRC